MRVSDNIRSICYWYHLCTTRWWIVRIFHRTRAIDCVSSISRVEFFYFHIGVPRDNNLKTFPPSPGELEGPDLMLPWGFTVVRQPPLLAALAELLEDAVDPLALRFDCPCSEASFPITGYSECTSRARCPAARRGRREGHAGRCKR